MLKRLLTTLLSLAALCASANDYNVMTFGAVGDGQTDDAAAIERAIATCSANGGGRVILPAGHIFMASAITLASYVDLHIEANATLLANPDESVYTLSAFRENRSEGMMWLHGENLTQLSITGLGTIDGNGVAFMGEELDDSYALKPLRVDLSQGERYSQIDPRPHVLTLINVHRLILRDITIRNSAYWTVHLVGCHDVTISGITILNNLKIRNGDGIDLDHSTNVRISDCYIESADDSICLKNRREYEEYGPCQNIVVSNCLMTSRSCALKIGSENVDTISNVLVSNCVIRDSNRGIGIQNRDEGTVHDVIFSNMTVDCRLWSDVWWGKSEPIYVTSYPRAVNSHKDAGWRLPLGATEGRCGDVYNITFSNIQCTSENNIFVDGDTPEKVRDIHFDNVNVNIVRRTAYPQGIYDKRPCAGEPFAYN